jgi:YesN/AraC family two-component response regulator
MDVQMPHCDGYEATKLIRKHSDPNIRNILIIAMTASAIQGDREKCLDSGMNNYLAKPVRAKTLKALLESYLSKEDDGEGPKEEELQKEAKRMVKEALSEADKVPKKVVQGAIATELEEKAETKRDEITDGKEKKGFEDVKQDNGTGDGLIDGIEPAHPHESAMAGVVREEREKSSRPTSIRQITAQRIPHTEEITNGKDNTRPNTASGLNSSSESTLDGQSRSGS